MNEQYYEIPKDRSLWFSVYITTRDGEFEYEDVVYTHARNTDQARKKVRDQYYPKRNYSPINKKDEYLLEAKESYLDYRIIKIGQADSDPNIADVHLNKTVRYLDFPSATQRLSDADIVLQNGDLMEYHWRLPNGDFIFVNTSVDDSGGMGIMPFKDAQENLNEMLRTEWDMVKFFDQEVVNE